MNVGDRVRIKDVGSTTFNNKTGVITASMKPDYDWAVLLDGTDDPEDSYGFNEAELKPAP